MRRINSFKRSVRLQRFRPWLIRTSPENDCRGQARNEAPSLRKALLARTPCQAGFPRPGKLRPLPSNDSRRFRQTLLALRLTSSNAEVIDLIDGQPHMRRLEAVIDR